MPPVSQAQRRLFFWAESHPEEASKRGIKPSVAKEFTQSDPGGKLPAHAAIGGGIGLGGANDNFGRQHQQIGGFSGSAEDPWWERSAAREMYLPGGFVNSSVAGRTDRLPVAVAADSHVIPADVLSGLGQDNSMHGAGIMAAILRSGPHGTQNLPQHGHGSGPPHPPSVPGEVSRELFGYAKGGQIDEHNIAHCLLAGGEFVIPPHDWTDGEGNHYRGVRSLGNGDLEKGHAALRRMTAIVRKHHIDFIKNAPPPKRSMGGAVPGTKGLVA